jgi:hypothetical protein
MNQHRQNHKYELSSLLPSNLFWLFIAFLIGYSGPSIHAQSLAEVGHYGENIGAVAVSGTKGIINEGTRVRVMELPVFGNPSFSGSVDVGGVPVGLQTVNSYAYSVSNTGKFHIISIANSSSPQIVGELDWADWKTSVWVRRSADYAYVTGCAGIRVIDIRNKNNPVLVATLPGECTYGITGDGGYLYVSRSSYSNASYLLDVYSLVNPSNPILIGSGPNIKSPVSHQYNGIAVFGDTVYTSGEAETYVIDVADRTQPQLKTTNLKLCMD